MKTITLINHSTIAQSFRFVCFVGCFFSLLVLGSCGASQVPVKLGYINTEGVEIRAEDGSFSLESGDSWAPPFRSTADYGDQEKFQNEKLTGLYDFALNHLRAKRVLVKTPYMEKELHGVLMLNEAFGGCSSPVTRSYQISIPEEYVEKALNGKVTVLYEYYDCEGLTSAKTWILWLSDVPF